MTKAEKHSVIITCVSGTIYLLMFASYLLFEIPLIGLFDLVFLAVLVVLISAILIFTFTFVWREMKEV